MLQHHKDTNDSFHNLLLVFCTKCSILLDEINAIMYFYMCVFVNISDLEKCAATVVYSLMSCRIITKWTLSHQLLCVTLCSAQPSPSTPSVLLLSSLETEEMQRTQIFLMDPLLLAVFCREMGSSRMCLKGGMCILTHQTSQSWAQGRRSNLSLLCGDKARGGVSILKCGYCSGALLSMAWRDEKGDEHVSPAPANIECSTLCCCSCKYCDLEVPSEDFSDK